MRQLTPFRKALAAVATAGALLAAGVAAPAPASAFTTTNGVRLNYVEARLAALINNARTSRGLAPLTVAPGTTDLARDWSMNQASKDLMYHNPNLVAGVQRHGSSDWRAVAENVGRGWSADSLFEAYMNSPGHRANILDSGMRYLGIGWVERPDGSGYNTQVFVDRYSTAYGRSRRPAVGGLKDTRTPATSMAVATFEGGWDPRAYVARSGSGISVSGPYFPSPATGDQSVRFAVKETLVSSGGAGEFRVRDALDLRNASGLRVKVSAVSASGRAVTLQVAVKRELGSTVVLGTVTVPSGGSFVTKTFPLPSGAKNFRNVVSVGVPRTSLHALSSSLSGRSVSVRVSDVAVMV
jgi:uncharacterized protein YkwD